MFSKSRAPRRTYAPTLRSAAAAALVLLATLAPRAHAQADLLPSIQKGTIAVGLKPIATGMAAPDYAIAPPGDVNRLFVVEQNGLLRVIQNGVLQPGSALDLSARVQPPLVTTNANDERGFLGLAFHPDYNNPNKPGFRTLYTYTSELIPAATTPTYPAPNNATQGYKNVISEYKASAADPNVIDPTTRRELISFGKNANNHNGGTIAFGRDGYLYLGTGDGGNANDVGASHVEPGGNAQNLGIALGKMLRIDPVNPTLTATSTDAPSTNGQYRIPKSNPFQAAGQVPEVFAYGFRNPYRFAFDRGGNGDLIMADVGQNNVEEINRVTLGGNYGWAVKEGTFQFNRVTGPGGNAGTVGPSTPGSPVNLIDPISGTKGTLQYDHQDGISITGGFVYRGTAIPELFGKYIFGDLALRGSPVRADGRLFYADLEEGVIKEFLIPQFANDQLPNGLTVHGFGEDGRGELYALVTNSNSGGTGGIVYQFVTPAAVPEPATLGLLALTGVTLLGRRRRRWNEEDSTTEHGGHEEDGGRLATDGHGCRDYIRVRSAFRPFSCFAPIALRATDGAGGGARRPGGTLRPLTPGFTRGKLRPGRRPLFGAGGPNNH